MNLEDLRKNFLKFTRKAFNIIPKINKPCILDIGCGSGVPTLELARLSKGKIIGIDIDKNAIDKLNIKIKVNNLQERVKVYKNSLFNIKFPSETFDIIWAEGALAPIGFEEALKQWKKFIKPEGFMVLHDDIKDKTKKMELIPKQVFELIDYFQLPDDAWWINYYGPLEKQIEKVLTINKNHPQVLKAIKSYQDEVMACKKKPEDFRSIFYVLKKIFEF